MAAAAPRSSIKRRYNNIVSNNVDILTAKGWLVGLGCGYGVQLLSFGQQLYCQNQAHYTRRDIIFEVTLWFHLEDTAFRKKRPVILIVLLCINSGSN